MMRKFAVNVAIGTGLLALLAAGIAIRSVRAQTTTIQPFTSTMIMERSSVGSPVPTVTTRTFVVRSDGSTAIVSTWDRTNPPQYIRLVVDRTNKTHITVDPVTHTIVTNEHDNKPAIVSGSFCEGQAAGQMQGYDVVVRQDTLTDAGMTGVHKHWHAPKLGCLPLHQEWTWTEPNGRVSTSKRSLTHITLGEPDPWYFEIPTGYTPRTSEDWLAQWTALMTAQSK